MPLTSVKPGFTEGALEACAGPCTQIANRNLFKKIPCREAQLWGKPKVYLLHVALLASFSITGTLENRDHVLLFFMFKLIAKLPLGFSKSEDGKVGIIG